uniref:E3 ubiquitin-protein ligase n=1 Tax=Gadus morhua TaxID=8049 RepID=A0A8C5BP86_GADMO
MASNMISATRYAWLQASDLHKEVYQHLALYVPKIYCLGPNLNPSSEDLLAPLLLLAPLEWYLLGEEPALALARLENSSQPSQLCGHVFKVGEPTYSCRSASHTPDVHKHMTTSGGGGFCDCGDTEAWKKGPYCHKHQANSSDCSLQDPLAQLSEDMVARGYNIFSVVLKYAVDMLTWDKEDLLPPGDRGDTYYCMLFNDEVHTYEQVIYTLQKAVNCTQKEAVSFATTVDREGRKSVRFGDFQFCDQAKAVIVRNTSRQSRPLRVQVMHSSVVAHQCFALRTLTWLGHIIASSDGLRRLLCQVGLQNGPEGENSSLVDTLMLCDSKMWKGARNVYHQLLMNSLLMDLKYKKLFALQFAKNYESLQSDYVRDDHDREFSITDLSVQIFTVPSLARMLMVEENLMTTIIRTFVDHLRHRDLQGRFQFERYTALQAFKFRRVQSLIGDLKYVLITRPTEWSDQLREKFLEGLDSFLELLKCMQGMDPVVRQVGQHIEMEPEWEAAFTLQMKLTHIITLMQEWCSTDETVLIRAYQKCLTALSQCHGGFTDGKQPISLSLAGHMVDTIRYPVSQERVSIHLPVSRLLAGLHVLLSKTDLANRSPEQLPLSELSPPMLIEHPLRCLVLCAQVHAGMWRRNGFSLINQIYYYHNVKCRVEMFDKDIIMLQVGASMMDPNHFLMVLLSRFELFHIFSSADCRRRYRDANKDVVQQNNTLIEEMLHLIIMIVGERYVQGVGQVEASDDIRREIIHQLSIRPMAHSELVKALPENENKETGLERVIGSVALFKKPGVTGRGLYELRPESTKHFNLYFHHYSRADQSKAEEAQRKLRKQNGEDSALPPPCPPPLCPLLAGVVGLLQSDVLLAVVSAVLQWTTEPSGGHWTESMLQRVLHLVAMALLEEKQQLESSSGDDDITFTFNSKISRPGEAPSTSGSILALLESLQNAPHLEAHKDMIQWVLKMVFTIKTMREQHTASTSAVNATGERDQAERKRKAEMARLRREKVMAQMCEMQKHFINENKELFQQTYALTGGPLAEDPEVLVCVGPRLPGPGPRRRQVVTCILCQEEEEVRAAGRAMVLAAFVQRSTVLSKNRTRSPPDPEHHDPLFMHPDLAFATHTASCGHIMHATCWQRYFEAVQAKEQRRQQRLRVHTSYDVENGEFLCPLCECLSNTVIPLLGGAQGTIQPSLEAWIKSSCHQRASPAGPPSPVPDQNQQTQSGPPSAPPDQSHLQGMITTFGTATYKVGLKVHPNDQDPRVPVMSWASCAYTIQTIVFHLTEYTQCVCVCVCVCVALVPGASSANTPCILDIDMFHLLIYTSVCVSSSALPEVSSGWQLWRCVQSGLLPFLRSAAIFFHHLNAVETPPELHVAGPDQWEALCSYLSLPSNLLQLYYRERSVMEALLQGCPRSGGDKSRAPTLCLVCGALLCSQSYCCQTEVEGHDVGACTAHTYSCGAGLGLFLRVRESQVLFLAGKTKGCFYPPPYLDDYGETDQGLRRGNPLRLCPERYRKIQKLWQQHSVTEEIGHAQEANQSLVGIDWQHL